MLAIPQLKVVGPSTRPQISVGGGCCFTCSPPPPVFAPSLGLPQPQIRPQVVFYASVSYHDQGCESALGASKIVPKMVGQIWKKTEMCPTIFHGPIYHCSVKFSTLRNMKGLLFWHTNQQDTHSRMHPLHTWQVLIVFPLVTLKGALTYTCVLVFVCV